MWKTPIGRVRGVGIIEGISFIVLLGIAMPLKYLYAIPMAVRIVGMAHGILFLLLCAVLYSTKQEIAWPLRRVAAVFIAALLPFGPFVIDGSLKREDESRGG